MHIAVQGCGHGNLNNIYARLAQLERQQGVKADLLLICGDFQAIRHADDLATLACPPKYRRMGDFAEYWEGKRRAPLLTLFIGGNHEASEHLWELYHGGWVAPQIYFMGYAGVVRFGGLRIGGIGGLYHPRHYDLGYFERPPYDAETLRSAYHTRRFDVARMTMLAEEGSPLDLFMSHEWPHGIYRHGNLAELLRCKPFFRQDIEHGSGIGAPPLSKLLSRLQPRHWFSAHMHVEFEATISHPTPLNGQKGPPNTTEFLALDKCLPGRRHLRILKVTPSRGQEQMATDDPGDTKVDQKLEYDEEWLAIVRAMNPFMSLARNAPPPPLNPSEVHLEEHRKFVRALKAQQGAQLPIPALEDDLPSIEPGRQSTLRQTSAFCQMLGIDNYWTFTPSLARTLSMGIPSAKRHARETSKHSQEEPKEEEFVEHADNPDEIKL